MAIIKIRNAAIDLDAAEIPNIDASKITSGSLGADRIPSLAASKIGSGTFADARIAASNVSQHATSFDDNKIVNDISTLAIRQASNENKAAYNTNSMYIDVFQDSTGITGLTNVQRNSLEFMSSVSSVTDSSVVFLLNQDTSSGSTTFTDATGNHSISSSGNPTWSNTQAKWGSNSIHLDGNDYLTLADSNDWYYADSGNGWTFEAWWYAVSSFHDGGIWYQGVDSSNGNPRNMIMLESNTSINFYDQVASNGGDDVSFSETVPAFVNNWRHIALVYDDANNQLQFAVDGTWLGNARSYATPSNNSNTVKIGRAQNSSGNTRYLNGYLDGMKISKKAQYTLGSNFSVPTSQFSNTTVNASATGSFTSNNITAPSSTNKMGAIITYQDNAGTNTLNTDIVLKLSADGGSNFTTATMTAMPDFASGIKMAKVNDLSVTAGTSLKYKIEFANQALGSKEARIRGVSLQY
jgi:hypothetical protein